MTGDRPLSAGQQALWLLHRLAPDSAAYNVATAVRVRADLDVGRLCGAVSAVARRHALIRSVFTEVDGAPRRLVGDPDAVRLQVRQLSGADRVDEGVAGVVRQPFRLAEGAVPVRLSLFRRAPDEAVLLVVAHHIVTDATSQWLLLADLVREYRDPGGERPPAGDFDAFVAAERRLLASPERDRLAAFWRDLCTGAVPAELPADRPRPPRQRMAGASHKLVFAEGTPAKVRAAAAGLGTTPFGFLLGVFTALLRRYSGQRDLTVGCAATARRSRASWDTVGYLVSPFVVRARFDPDATFADAVRAADAGVTNGIRYGRYPFPVLVQDLDLPRRLDRTPLFQITFTMLEPSTAIPLSRLLPAAAAEGPEIEYAGLRLAALDIPQMEGAFDLSVEVRARAGTLAAVFRYDTDLYDAATIDRFARHYARLVEAAASDPAARLDAVSLLDDAEQRRLLALGTGI